MKSAYNVLVFPGGTEIALEIRSSLCRCKDVNLFSAGSDVSNHASFAFERHFVVPSISEYGCVERLNQLIDEQGIDYIYPAYDDIVVFLVENSSRINAKIITSPRETCRITRSKRLTYEALSGSVPVPHLYQGGEVAADFPVFVKPDKGQGSQHAYLVAGRKQLEEVIRSVPEPLILEYLPGEEFTVDCFSDRDAGLLFAGGRTRLRTRSGISMHSQTDSEKIFRDYAERIGERLLFHGAWFFQLKRDSQGVLKLLEVAPRIAGTMAVHRVRGINFPLLSIYEQERFPLTILDSRIDIEVDRALVNRYRHNLVYHVVYVDFDDTLILSGKVNRELVSFIFQCINRKIKVILISKHAGDIQESLRKYRLDRLFDEVIHLGQDQSKAEYVTEPGAIFIDDSFSERRSVAESAGVLTFDSSMLELLLDDRV